jgi:hypothetical protein
MLKDEFTAKYPHLAQTMENLAADNNMKLLDVIEVPLFLNPSIDLAERQAAQLSDEEKETIALGDDDARQDLTTATGFEHLDNFVTEAFEGLLTDMLFKPPALSG